MYLFIISCRLLMLANIIIEATCYEEIPSRRTNTGTVKSDEENCLCFPGGQSLIPELSNRQSNGLERLVVYLYKNKYTDEVYVFQPSAEKQSLIPDIPYTPGDLLQPVTTETIVSLFSNHSNNTPKTQQTVNTKGEPIGLNIGIVNEARPNNRYSDGEFVGPSQSPHIGWYPSQHQQQIHTQSEPKGQFDLTGIESNIIHHIIKPIKSSDLDDSTLKTDVIVNNHSEKDTSTNIEEISSIPLNSYQIRSNIQPAESQNNYNIHQGDSNLPKRLSTFDDWFNEQMETVQKQKMSEGVNKIDSDGLRPLVLKTLFDNNFHISDNGMMRDDSGTLIDLNNLEIRPILIGSPIKFQALGLNPQLTFQDTLPYLEGILIMLVNPFRILGVLPVGKTYVSSPGKVNNPNSNSNYKNSNSINANTVELFSKIPLHSSLQTQATMKSNNPFKLIELPESSVPSVFSVNQKLPETLDQEPLDSELAKFQNFAVKIPFTSEVVLKNDVEGDFKSFDNNVGWNSLSNVRLGFQRSGSQFPHLKVSPIKRNLNVKDNYNLGSIFSQKQNSNFDISALRKGNPHLTATPLRNKERSQFTQFNRNVQNINAFPIKNHVGASSNSFWYNFYPADNKNALLKPDSSSHLSIPTNGISESPFDSDRSHLKLIVNPLNKVFDPSARHEYSPGFNSKYFTVGSDIVDTSTWDSFQNSGWGNNNGHLSTQHLPPQQSSWFSNEWGEAIIKSIPSVLNSEMTGIEIPNWNNLDDSENQPQVESDTYLGPTRRFSSPVLKGVLKTLIQMIIENLVNKKNPEDKPEKENDKILDGEVNSTVSNPKASMQRYAGNDGDDGPDYRIIGGSAATGSGSPLSNKGRSGLSII